MEYTESSTQKFITINENIKKEKKISKLTFHLMKLAKEQQTKPKARKRKGIINIKVKINERENRKTMERITKQKIGFFEKINKIDTPFFRLTKKKEERNKITKIRNERGNVTTKLREI